ncbi:TetR/AcrR family transcriptional regulator [Kushneria aurantia]|uniref:TetR/AcrR family transcriptional regulator n=1 Tax=Kushneria aurantia TaxID=504092 RepID=A0ABV6FZF4_9GAMM|nr:TetR/AcrR family transcriptional regulator [Kushneria aurantia]
MNVSDERRQTAQRKSGRPRSFDREAALEKAMLLFWRHGYETTSISDLTRAMGITAPSLYTAFGDKRRLFLEAAQLYAGEPDAENAAIANAPTAYDAASTILHGAIVTFTGETTPPGCLLASATASGSADAADVRAIVAGYRQQLREQMRARLERDKAAGMLPQSADAAALSGLVLTVMQGLSVLARDGASPEDLSSIVDTALHAWPTAGRC